MDCAVYGCRDTKIQACHVRRGTDGGMGLKPSDGFTIPLCASHHRAQHQVGERRFEEQHSLNMRALAEFYAKASPHLKR
jgi:hypothetical protein